MMDKNNLGSFNSLQELWEAHPEGGHEGDYATVNGVVFRWNKYNLIWSGTGTPMETYGRKTDVHEGDVVINNDLTVAGMIRARGVKQPNKGLFHDLASLQKRYPFPEVGWWATVGDSVPGQIYRCDQPGVWSATGETGGLDSVDYEKINKIEQLLQEGYIFMGVATPKTNPGTPDRKAFYIANGKGTYTNFGDIDVNEDEAVLLTYDGIWSKLKSGIATNNFKTINNQKITGEGNIEIQGGGSITVDEALSETSVNPVQNKVITAEILAMKELLALLDDKVFPTTLSVSGGGTYDEGTSQTVMVSWKLMKNGQALVPDSVSVNGETVDPATGYKVFTDVTTTTTYRVSVVYKGKTYTGSTTATFKKTYYRYYGALPVDTAVGSITADMIKGLKKEVCTGAAAVLLFTTVNQRMAYAYPSVFGKLTAVKDTNFNAPYDDFLLESTLDIDGTEYYVYAFTNPNTATDFSLTFVK